MLINKFINVDELDDVLSNFSFSGSSPSVIPFHCLIISNGRVISLPSIIRLRVKPVDSFELDLYAPAKQPRFISQLVCSPGQ